ncbi:MAG: response regulator transcription factor [Bacteroidota bacterium]|nr:response regulator transcription factor [Bacteroidota bacterium]
MNYVILADNQDLSKAGLLFFLNQSKEHSEVVEADSKKELVKRLTEYPDALVILDYTLFDFSGPDDLHIQSERFHQAHWILFSEELSDEFLRTFVLNHSSFSVIFKDCGKEEICSAIELAFKHERFICNHASNQLLRRHQVNDMPDNVLTATEKEILHRLALGKTTKEIAAERFSSVHTITTHRKNIFRKLGVNTVYEATKYALRAGIVDSAEYYI